MATARCVAGALSLSDLRAALNARTANMRTKLNEKEKVATNQEVFEILKFQCEALGLRPQDLTQLHVKLALVMFVEGVKFYANKIIKYEASLKKADM